MKRACSISILALLVALLTLVSTTQQASAHGGRHVLEKYVFTVGFLDEPAYAQLKNGLDLTICAGAAKGHEEGEAQGHGEGTAKAEAECAYTVKDGTRVLANPVEKAEQTLKAEVTVGSASPLPLTLSPRFNNPGKYAAYFVPSKEGAYTFRIYGTLNGDKIDEKFTSGKDDFSEVDTITAYPSTPDAKEVARQNQLKAAETTANNAMTAAIVGGVVGLLGAVLAAFALLRKRNSPQAVDAASSGSAPADSLRG